MSKGAHMTMRRVVMLGAALVAQGVGNAANPEADPAELADRQLTNREWRRAGK